MIIFSDFGRTEKKLVLLVLALLFCCWLWHGLPTCSASEIPAPQQEQTYTITETQLKGLETRLALLDQILAQQNPELTTLLLQLTESKKELVMLRNELSMSREQLTKADESLRNANLFLEKSAQEAKQERLRIKAQRNGWAAAAACLAIALAVK